MSLPGMSSCAKHKWASSAAVAVLQSIAHIVLYRQRVLGGSYYQSDLVVMGLPIGVGIALQLLIRGAATPRVLSVATLVQAVLIGCAAGFVGMTVVVNVYGS